MESFKVVPDVIDVVPPQTIEVEYDGGLVVEQGTILTPTQVKDAPARINWPHEEGSLYTLIMTDPDSSIESRQIKHWLVINIPGDKLQEGNTIASYRGAGPPKNTGHHRYIFLVHKQPGRLETDESSVGDDSRIGRRKFNTRDFAEKHALGQPVAGNFFRAEYDDYVRVRRTLRT